MFKLSPRSTKVILIGYFRRKEYKLIFKSQHVIFEKEATQIALQPTPSIFIDNYDFFGYKLEDTLEADTVSSNKRLDQSIV